MQDMVMLGLESEKMEDVLHEMVGFLKKRNKIAKEKELYEKLIQEKDWEAQPLVMVLLSLTAK